MMGEVGPGLPEPVEEQLADRLTRQAGPGPSSVRVASLLRRLGGYDRAVYRRVAGLSTPLPVTVRSNAMVSFARFSASP